MSPGVKRRGCTIREGSDQRCLSPRRAPKRTAFSQAVKRPVPRGCKLLSPRRVSSPESVVILKQKGLLKNDLRCPPSPNLRRRGVPSKLSVNIDLNITMEVAVSPNQTIPPLGDDDVHQCNDDERGVFHGTLPVSIHLPPEPEETQIDAEDVVQPLPVDNFDATLPISVKLPCECRSISATSVEQLPPTGDGQLELPNQISGSCARCLTFSILLKNKPNESPLLENDSPGKHVAPSAANSPPQVEANSSPSRLQNFRSPPARVRVPTFSIFRDPDNGPDTRVLEGFKERVKEKKARLASLSARINKLMAKVHAFRLVDDIPTHRQAPLFSPLTCEVDFDLKEEGSYPVELAASSSDSVVTETGNSLVKTTTGDDTLLATGSVTTDTTTLFCIDSNPSTEPVETTTIVISNKNNTTATTSVATHILKTDAVDEFTENTSSISTKVDDSGSTTDTSPVNCLRPNTVQESCVNAINNSAVVASCSPYQGELISSLWSQSPPNTAYLSTDGSEHQTLLIGGSGGSESSGSCRDSVSATALVDTPEGCAACSATNQIIDIQTLNSDPLNSDVFG
eukprot:TRINITY_DN4055_c0_g1_i1.p1 TRINITY_DN4055_c0_g1~~TRINITY_DN4055_c0_g1_i1.p1  ORF type:complete len:569 (+),score=84.47 TRINITY_DN4055_c0_g1_i1:548-2254(+)